MTGTNEIRSHVQNLLPSLIRWRRDFHQHPEIGFQETRTASTVASHLHALGIEVTTGVGRTGVVGVIDGYRSGLTVLLRFDMDALPIQEETGLSFTSLTPGMMHACGHDGHTAIGMGVAQLLAKTREQWPGQVKLLFQPAEEGLGGALATIEDGLLDHPQPDLAFGMHLWNQWPSGQLAIQEGPIMAAADRFTITITGRGGHGAQPDTTIDAIHVAAQVISALHTIVSRNVPPQETAVLSIGSLHAGDTFNVIAEEASMTGTLRTFSVDTRTRLIQRMEQVLAGTVAAHGAKGILVVDDHHTPAVINDPVATKIALSAAIDHFGPDRITTIAPLMVAEDMAEILNRVPGCYLLLGAAPPGGALGPHHSPRFDFDEAMLAAGTELMTGLALHCLTQHRPS